MKIASALDMLVFILYYYLTHILHNVTYVYINISISNAWFAGKSGM